MRVAIVQGQNGSCANELIPFSAYPKYGKILPSKAQYTLAGVNYVPIKLHVLRTNIGTTSFDPAAFMDGFMELNRNFRDINIQFYIVPQINYINNTGFYDLNAEQDEENLCSANDVNDALNLYFTNSILFNSVFNATGYAYYPSPSAASNRVFITNSSLNIGGRTLTHELGHYFNLLHTFNENNNPDIGLRELVTRGFGANCTTAGDLICDTPADPYGLSGATTNGCAYTGNLIDANGTRFTPEMSNTMSYYSEICGSEFSGGQLERLSEGYVFRNSPDNQYTIQYTNPAVEKPTGLVAVTSQAGIILTFEDNANNELGYIVERSTDADGIFKPIKAGVANVESIIDQDLNSNTTYYYRIRAANGIEYSNVAETTSGIFYCTPSYLQNCNDFAVVIEQFSIAGTPLSNLDSGCSPNNYGKFTNMVADLAAGSSYTFTASANTTTNVPFYAQALSVWADFNQDGIFENSELVYRSSSAPGSGMNPAVTALINIPENAKPGFTVLRARSQYGVLGNVISPCDELITGETEDYTINIVSPMQNNAVAVTSISPLTVCRGGSFTVGYETTGNGFSENTLFTVQIDNGGGQFINLPTQSNGRGTLSAIVPTSFATGTNFNVRVVANNPAVTSPVSVNKLAVNALPVIPTLVINQASTVVCAGAVVSVNAAGCNGTVNWSSGQTGNPVTFSVNSPIALTASCTANGCTSNASAVMSISTKPLPNSPTVQFGGGKSNFCVGEIVTLNASGCIGVVNWSNGSTGNPLSFTAASSVSLSATCKIDGCESLASAAVAVTVNTLPAAPTLSVSGGSNGFCLGENATLNASGCTGTVNWSNGMTGNSITFRATSSVSLSATCTENGCSSRVSNVIAIVVIERSPPPVISVNNVNNGFCIGDEVTARATGCVNSLPVWSNGDTGNATSFRPSTSISLTARCQNPCGDSEVSNVLEIVVNPVPTPPIIAAVGGNNQCVGESVSLTASGCAGMVIWSNEMNGNIISVTVREGDIYTATCLESGCLSPASNPLSFTCIPAGSKIKPVSLDLKVILEGPYDSNTNQMKTSYNEQGLLPGQTPKSRFAVATPSGQPYNRTPWNYNGSENKTNYASTVVDWVLVSLKDGENELLYQTAALLHADTHIEFVKNFPELDTTQTYFVQIDHRNHLGVMTQNKVAVEGSKITYDFTKSDSFIKPDVPAFGQKILGSLYGMFVGDIDKSTPSQHYDINFADITKLRKSVGVFGQYLDADLNLDADVNFNDLIIWRLNSGKFSSITY